ncbi:hypothetical protein PTMSG1_09734 [Pyrenophora teres f. maculata]|nr:hypothetical protein PTMSG1_09734 [Pyrenophora teres f. maculata]
MPISQACGLCLHETLCAPPAAVVTVLVLDSTSMAPAVEHGYFRPYAAGNVSLLTPATPDFCIYLHNSHHWTHAPTRTTHPSADDDVVDHDRSFPWCKAYPRMSTFRRGAAVAKCHQSEPRQGGLSLIHMIAVTLPDSTTCLPRADSSLSVTMNHIDISHGSMNVSQPGLRQSFPVDYLRHLPSCD